MSSLVGATVAALRDVGPWRRIEVGGQPDGFVRLEAVLGRGPGTPLRRWFELLCDGVARGRTDVAGSYLAAQLAGIVADPVVEAVAATGRAWSCRPEQLAVHCHESGWFDGLAIGGATVRVLPSDPCVGHPDAEVIADRAALEALVASDLVATLGPIFAGVGALAPYGLAGMWGAAADGIAGATLAAARAQGRDQAAAWRVAASIVDRMAVLAPALRARPTLEPITWDGGSALVAVRGTCCLAHKVEASPPIADDSPSSDPAGVGLEGYCTACPQRPAASRHRRWAAHLATGG